MKILVCIIIPKLINWREKEKSFLHQIGATGNLQISQNPIKALHNHTIMAQTALSFFSAVECNITVEIPNMHMFSTTLKTQNQKDSSSHYLPQSSPENSTWGLIRYVKAINHTGDKSYCF